MRYRRRASQYGIESQHELEQLNPSTHCTAADNVNLTIWVAGMLLAWKLLDCLCQLCALSSCVCLILCEVQSNPKSK